MHKPRLCLPSKIFLIIGLNNRCVEIYIDLSTNEHNICIMSLLEELNHLNVLLKLKLNPKVFNFSRMFV
jgi:hypothetical protein